MKCLNCKKDIDLIFWTYLKGDISYRQRLKIDEIKDIFLLESNECDAKYQIKIKDFVFKFQIELLESQMFEDECLCFKNVIFNLIIAGKKIKCFSNTTINSIYSPKISSNELSFHNTYLYYKPYQSKPVLMFRKLSDLGTINYINTCKYIEQIYMMEGEKIIYHIPWELWKYIIKFI